VLWSLAAFTPKVDTKVVSTPTMVGNGAIIPIDNLETSIISNAPFSAGLMEINLIF